MIFRVGWESRAQPRLLVVNVGSTEHITMLVSQTDYDFFSSPSSLSSSSSAVRVTIRPRVPSHCSNPANSPRNSSPVSSSPFSLSISKKRKIVDDNDDRFVSSFHSTANQPPQKRKVSQKRKSAVTRVPSRASSRHNPSPEPIYRIHRSRSTSQLPILDSETQCSLFKRRWRTEQHGNPGDGFLGSEDIVRRLVKSYKTCVWYFPLPGACL